MQELFAPFKICWQAVRMWLDELATNIVINLGWLFCWLTIVLGPPATFSMIQATRTLVDGYYPTRQEFISGIRQYFLKSWQWVLANLVMLTLFGANITFYGSLNVSWGIYVQGFFLGLLLLWLGIQFYALPFLIIQEQKSLRAAWKNGLLTLLASPVYSLVLNAFAIVILVLGILTVLPILLGAGALLTTLANLAVKDRLEMFDLARGQSEQADPADTETEPEE